MPRLHVIRGAPSGCAVRAGAMSRTADNFAPLACLVGATRLADRGGAQRSRVNRPGSTVAPQGLAGGIVSDKGGEASRVAAAPVPTHRSRCPVALLSAP